MNEVHIGNTFWLVPEEVLLTERTKYNPREGKHQEDSEIRGRDVEGEESYAEWGIIVTVSGQQRMTASPFRLSTCIHT